MGAKCSRFWIDCCDRNGDGKVNFDEVLSRMSQTARVTCEILDNFAKTISSFIEKLNIPAAEKRVIISKLNEIRQYILLSKEGAQFLEELNLSDSFKTAAVKPEEKDDLSKLVEKYDEIIAKCDNLINRNICVKLATEVKEKFETAMDKVKEPILSAIPAM